MHFHWDLEKAFSMRCRVSQNWAGKGWGGMVIPRIGMEVVVEFLEGDPDKPLVTGYVYNGKNDVPYPLPEHKTRSTFKTDTYQGTGFNELRFEDETGRDEVFLHAQKDRNTKVENNQTERVNVNKVESVGHNKGTEIGNISTEVVVGDKFVHVGPSQKGRYSPGSASEETQGLGNVANGFGLETGKGNLEISVENNHVLSVVNNDTQAVGKNRSETIGHNHYITVGKQFVLEAGEEIVLKCGRTMITLEKI